MLRILFKSLFLVLVFTFGFVTTVGFLVFNQGLVTVEADTDDDFLNLNYENELFSEFDTGSFSDIQEESKFFIKKDQEKKEAAKKTTSPKKIYGPQVTISKIGVYTAVRYETVRLLADFERQLLYNPVVESELTSDFCTKGENTYLAGHSESPSAGVNSHPAVNVFSNLTELKSGDKITVTNKNGVKCSYRVKYLEVVRTGKNGEVSPEVFQDVFYPETNGATWLTIQTCKKGSATERIVLRAEMIR